MAATEASPVGNDMETVETQLAQHEVCTLFYYNIVHYSLHIIYTYNTSSFLETAYLMHLAFWKRTPMNIPKVKMFPLCVCEVFVKVHITNKVVVQNKSGPVCVCFFLSVHSIKGAHDYLLCMCSINSEKDSLPVHDSLFLLY